jgi:hypothetical protein
MRWEEYVWIPISVRRSFAECSTSWNFNTYVTILHTATSQENVSTCVPNITHCHIPGERQYLCTKYYILSHSSRTSVLVYQILHTATSQENVSTCAPNITHCHIPGERQYLCTKCYTLSHPSRTSVLVYQMLHTVTSQQNVSTRVPNVTHSYIPGERNRDLQYFVLSRSLRYILRDISDFKVRKTNWKPTKCTE